MTRYNRRNTGISDTLKDYLVPLIGWFLLILLLWSVFSGESTPVVEDSENRVPAEILFTSPETEAFVVYPGDKKEAIINNSSLYKWESIIIKEWSLQLKPTSSTTIKLNKVAELKYVAENSYSHYSSDAWFDSSEALDISMRYASISTSDNTVLSLTQNEAVSTIYVLAGTAKVTNLWWSTTNLIKGQKVSVSRQDAAKWDIDLASEKSDIDSYFKSSDWFIENEGYIVLQKEDATDISPDDSESGSTVNIWSTGRYLSFTNLSDEMNVETSSLDISWTIVSESVGTISIGSLDANIGDDKSFSINGVTLPNKVNDLVIKIYDINQNILEKKVYTVYSSSPNIGSSTPTSSSSGGQSLGTTNPGGANFSVDGTDFGFTAPSVTGKFSTSGSEITIRWVTTAEWISKVTVNGFELASFNGSTWRYHAFTRFENLKDGSNQYKVDYFDENGSVVYTDYYTIVKKDGVSTPVVNPTSTGTPSEETDEDVPEETLL